MPSNRGKKSTGKAARAGGSQANADDWEALKGLALLFGFFKWCGFAAWGVCLLSQSLAWPWFVIAIAAWVAASWTRRRSDRAYERPLWPYPHACALRSSQRRTAAAIFEHDGIHSDWRASRRLVFRRRRRRRIGLPRKMLPRSSTWRTRRCSRSSMKSCRERPAPRRVPNSTRTRSCQGFAVRRLCAASCRSRLDAGSGRACHTPGACATN